MATLIKQCGGLNGSGVFKRLWREELMFHGGSAEDGPGFRWGNTSLEMLDDVCAGTIKPIISAAVGDQT